MANKNEKKEKKEEKLFQTNKEEVKLDSTNSNIRVGFIHNNSTNILYADGHAAGVQRLTTGYLDIATSDEHPMRGKSGTNVFLVK